MSIYNPMVSRCRRMFRKQQIWGVRSEVPPSFKVTFCETIPRRVKQEIIENPDVEVGGKWIGVLSHNVRFPTHDIRSTINNLCINIIDYIDSGENAVRTRGSIHPDSEYQYKILREVQEHNPDVCYIGSWHSHHTCNLKDLSPGDKRNYTETVNGDNHNIDIFFTSLMLDGTGFENARHFLFLRGERHYLEIPQDCIRMQRKQWSPVADARKKQGPQWYETPGGEKRIAEDKAIFNIWFQKLQLKKRSNIVYWIGEFLNKKNQNCIAVFEYPENYPFTGAKLYIKNNATNETEVYENIFPQEVKNRVKEAVEMSDNIAKKHTDKIKKKSKFKEKDRTVLEKTLEKFKKLGS